MVKMGNGHNSIDSLIMMNDLQQLAVPSTTAVSSSIPSREDFQQNRTNNLANIVGSIGPAPDMLGGLSEEELLEIVMSVSPVGASISGGKVAKTTLNQLLGLLKKTGVKPPKGITAGDLRGKGLENILDRNIYSKARIQNQKALDKYGIADPDKSEFVDPISSYLTRSSN